MILVVVIIVVVVVGMGPLLLCMLAKEKGCLALIIKFYCFKRYGAPIHLIHKKTGTILHFYFIRVRTDMFSSSQNRVISHI